MPFLIFRARNNLKWQSQKDNTNTQIRMHVSIHSYLLAFIVDAIVWRRTFSFTSAISVALIGFAIVISQMERQIKLCVSS